MCVLCSQLFFTHLRFKPFRFIELRVDQPQNSSHIHWLSSCIINWGYIHVIRPKYRFSTVLVICMTSFRRIECSGLLPPWRFLHEVKSCRVKVDYCIVVSRLLPSIRWSSCIDEHRLIGILHAWSASICKLGSKNLILWESIFLDEITSFE